MEKERKVTINPKILLPKDLIIKTAGYHLYTLGFTNQHINELFIEKRNILHNPIIIVLSNMLYLIRCTIAIFTTNKRLSFLMGNWCAFVGGINFNMNLAKISYVLISMISQVLHYWYTRDG